MTATISPEKVTGRRLGDVGNVAGKLLGQLVHVLGGHVRPDEFRRPDGLPLLTRRSHDFFPLCWDLDVTTCHPGRR